MERSINIPSELCKYLEVLENQKNFSSNTLRAYSSDILQLFQLKPHIEVCRKNNEGEITYRYHLQNPNTKEIQKTLCGWKSQLEHCLINMQGKMPTKKRKISVLNQFLTWLKTDRGLDMEVSVEAPRGHQRKLPHFLSVDECQALSRYGLGLADPSPQQRQMVSLFFLLYGGGLRVSEACGLQWSQIQMDKKTAVFKGKGGNERAVVFPPKVIEILKTYGSAEGSYLWGKKPLPLRTAYSRIRRFGMEAGLYKPLHPHALRHSFATQLLGSGADLRVIQQLLGHKSLAATEIYTHLDVSQLAQTMESFHPLSKK